MRLTILFTALGLMQLTAGSIFAAVTNRVIATSGIPLPGAPNSIVLGDGLAQGLRAINARGEVAFIAPLSSTSTGPLFDTNAVVLADANGLQTLARTGDPIPGGSGAAFGLFSALAINDAAGVAVRDSFSFDDRLLGNLSGAWQIVARGNSPAPNPPGGTFGQLFATPQIGGTPVLRASGIPQWLFQASTTSPTFQSGLWGVTSNGQPFRALLFNGPAPGLSGGELIESNLFTAVSPPPSGKAIFQGFLRRTGSVNFGNREVLYSGDAPENFQVVTRTGDTLPAAMGAGTWASFRGLDGNQNGQICFIGDWFGSQSMSGVFLKGAGDPVLLVKRGDNAPIGDGFPYGRFDGFGEAAINASGQVVFSASGTFGATEDTGFFNALYRWQGNAPRLVVRTGTNSTWAGAPAGWRFNVLQRWNVNASGAVAFFAFVRNASGSLLRYGLWVAPGDQAPQLVAHNGISFTSPPEGVVALSLLRDPDSFASSPPSGGADGRVRFLADNGNAVVFAGSLPFPSTNSAIFVSQVTGSNAPPPVATVPEYVIATVAGDGTRGDSGDGGQALLAKFTHPLDVAVDAQGNVYVADRDAYRVRKISTNGIINTVAGTGTPGFSGYGGAANQTQIGILPSLALDSAGNLFIADVGYLFQQGPRIHRVDTNGIMSAFAGTGTAGFSGDEGPALNAMVNIPIGVEVDSLGRVYFYESGNGRFRRVDASRLIQTIAGTGTKGFSGDNGPATNADVDGIGLSEPMTIDASGNLYFAQDFHRIRKVSTNGLITTAFEFNGTTSLSGIAIDAAGNLFFSDDYNGRILRRDTNGIVAVIAGNGSSEFSGDGGPALAAGLQQSAGNIALDEKGNVFFINRQRVRRLSPTGNLLPVVPSYVSQPTAGEMINLGQVTYLDGTNIAFGNPKIIAISNPGLTDLRVESVAIVNPSNHFRVIVSSDDSRNLRAASLPHTIEPRVEDDILYIHLDPNVPSPPPGIVTNTLRIVSNDPNTPIVDYTVVAGYSYTTSAPVVVQVELETGFFNFLFSLGKPAPKGPRRYNDQARLAGNEVATFSLDQSRAQSLTSEVPDFLGGGSIFHSNLTGTMTVALAPLVNDTNQSRIIILSGSFEAPSVRLPSGIQTGPNRLVFGPPSVSDGLLNLSNNQFTATTLGVITNDLFPNGLPVRGNYTGTFDELTGRTIVESHSFDYVFASEPLQFLKTTTDWAIGWNRAGLLQTATNVLGPWITLSNAVSPFQVNTRQAAQQFFRVRSEP